MPRNLKYWGCSDRHFETVSAMVIHLESGLCPGNWNIRQLNALAAESTYARHFVVPGEERWFPGGAATFSIAETGFDDENDAWICSIRNQKFFHRNYLHQQLKTQSCSKVYPKVLTCSVCPKNFATPSGMLQHIETPRCPISRHTAIISELLEKLRTNLAEPAIQERSKKVLYK